MNIPSHGFLSGYNTIQDKSKEFRWLEKEGKLVLQVACPF